MFRLFSFLFVAALRVSDATRGVVDRRRREEGQATAEYALVLLGVAAVALLLAAWAAKSGKIGQLFDAVINQLIGKAR
ncbi:MAG: DUF4244 domain-containing protein [Acidimicrobiales bacterium]